METTPLEESDREVWAQRLAASLHAQRDHARQFLADCQKRLERAEVVVAGELRRLGEELAIERDEAERLRAAHDELAASLAEAEARLAEAETQDADADLQRRYREAVEELRQASNRNAELQQQVAKARSTAAKLAEQSRRPGWLNWEAEKQRILAALENDIDENDPSQHSERSKIVEVLRTTDEVIAAKDQEIQELKEQLAACGNGGSPIVQVVSADAALDSDAMIQQERERLHGLQEQWREKLREAEVEMALERAKMARQRAELDEQLRAANVTAEPASLAEVNGRTERECRGRWLARLGLTSADRAPPRQF